MTQHELRQGYYWIKFKSLRVDQEPTIGYYTGENEEMYPWTVIASDEIFKSGEFEIIEAIPNINI